MLLGIIYTMQDEWELTGNTYVLLKMNAVHVSKSL
jgi:hypothetical protein